MQNRAVVNQTLREPQSQLLLSGLNRVTAVAYIPTHNNAVIATDSANLSSLGVGGTEHLATGKDDIVSLKSNSNDRAAGDVLNERREERLRREIRVVSLSQLLGDVQELEATEGVALGQEAAEDGSDQTALDAIRLDHDESGLQKKKSEMLSDEIVNRLVY